MTLYFFISDKWMCFGFWEINVFACSVVYALHGDLSTQLLCFNMQSRFVCIYTSFSSLHQSSLTGQPVHPDVFSNPYFTVHSYLTVLASYPALFYFILLCLPCFIRSRPNLGLKSFYPFMCFLFVQTGSPSVNHARHVLVLAA